MEAGAVSIRPLLGVFLLLLLLAAHGRLSCAQKLNAASLHISPDRLQFFEYESIYFSCLANNGWPKWMGVRNTKEFISMCAWLPDPPSPAPARRVPHAIPSVNCTISSAFEPDSKEYWCETEEGEKSNTVNIVVTGGSVILESPSFPVKEGQSVTLLCRQKAALQSPMADFYKGGVHLWTSHDGKLVIDNVSRSDQGQYKCNISGAGASAESWLFVINNEDKKVASVVLKSPAVPVMEGDPATLSCRDETSSATLPAAFYKDGIFIGTGSAGNMTIRTVYKSHEGLYKCRISGSGESPGNWLSVTALPAESCPHVFLHFLLRTGIPVVMMAMLLVLLFFLRGQEKKIPRKKKDPEENTESP